MHSQQFSITGHGVLVAGFGALVALRALSTIRPHY